MSTCVIQRIETLTMINEQDLADGYEPLFYGRFSYKKYFVAALHEGGITGVAQDNNEQDDNNDNDDANTYEDPDNLFVIALEPVTAHDEMTGVPPQ